MVPIYSQVLCWKNPCRHIFWPPTKLKLVATSKVLMGTVCGDRVGLCCHRLNVKKIPFLWQNCLVVCEKSKRPIRIKG